MCKNVFLRTNVAAIEICFDKKGQSWNELLMEPTVSFHQGVYLLFRTEDVKITIQGGAY